MRFQRIHEAVNFQPWFISAAGYASVKSLVERAMAQPPSEKSDLGDIFSDFVRIRPAMEFDDKAKLATIYVFGVVGPYLSNIEKACGNTGYEDIRSDIEQAKLLRAQRINFIFDSPGGAMVGCDETARAISSLKDETNITTVAFTDTLMCSAAYYLAAGCDVISASPSAIVGNVGVICPWVDSSLMWALDGLEFQPITNDGADLKSTMHGPSITDDQRAFLQESVNAKAAMFKSHVAGNRHDISEEVWRAGWYGGYDALTLGLVDIVSDSIESI